MALDEPLFARKVQNIVEQTRQEIEARRKGLRETHMALGHEFGEAYLVRMIGSDMGVLRDLFVPGVDKACREAQRSGGNEINSEFIRRELLPRVLAVINDRKDELREGLETLLLLADDGNRYLPSVLGHVSREIDDLGNALKNRYEIEALQLASTEMASGRFDMEQENLRNLIDDAERDTVLWLQANPSTEERLYVHGMQAKLEELSRIVTHRIEGRVSPAENGKFLEIADELPALLRKATEVRGNIVGKGLARLADHLSKGLPGSRVRLVTQVLAPPIALSGTGGWAPARSKPTQIPPGFPSYFPNGLKARTTVILAEAVRKFPRQTQTLELCKHVISEMTPLFCDAVENGTITAGAVLEQGLGGMGDLLHSLLVYNDDGPRGGFSSLSSEGYRLEQEARKSEEWLRLAKAIVEAEERRRTHPTLEQNKPQTSAAAPYLDKLIGCLAVEPADLWPEYGEAAPYVKQLAEIEWGKKTQWDMSGNALESHQKREELLRIISREYPETAKKLGLPLVEASEPSTVESKLTNAAASPFTHSEDYRTVTVRGKTYTLTSQQAQMIEILHKAHEYGNADVSIALILEGLEKKSGRWQDTFKSNPEAKEALVKPGERKGTLRLKV